MGMILYIPRPKPSFEAIKYGALYNKFAVFDSRNITSSGWHISTKTETETLITYVGGGTYPFLKLRETGTVYWTAGTGATNEFGFNLRGAGYRNYSDGVFTGLKSYGIIATQTGSLWYALQSNVNGSYTLQANFNTNGFSARAIKDSTTLTHGQTGTYTGNDGKVYRTICIGTQEWLADNLAETKFRNGDWISGFDGGVYTPISNANWVLRGTSGESLMCAYLDDLSKV